MSLSVCRSRLNVTSLVTRSEEALGMREVSGMQISDCVVLWKEMLPGHADMFLQKQK